MELCHVSTQDVTHKPHQAWSKTISQDASVLSNHYIFDLVTSYFIYNTSTILEQKNTLLNKWTFKDSSVPSIWRLKILAGWDISAVWVVSQEQNQTAHISLSDCAAQPQQRTMLHVLYHWLLHIKLSLVSRDSKMAFSTFLLLTGQSALLKS